MPDTGYPVGHAEEGRLQRGAVSARSWQSASPAAVLHVLEGVLQRLAKPIKALWARTHLRAHTHTSPQCYADLKYAGGLAVCFISKIACRQIWTLDKSAASGKSRLGKICGTWICWMSCTVERRVVPELARKDDFRRCSLRARGPPALAE